MDRNRSSWIMPVLIVLLALLATPAFAQDPPRPPQGIGFAQAEEGTWLCRHDSPEEALSCARELCIEQASGQECWQTAWCYPANWSGLMTIWLADFHTTHVLCGAPSEASLTQALAAICAGDAAATSCDVTLVIDPEGNETTPEGVSFAGPAAPQGSGADALDGTAPEAASPDASSPAAGAPDSAENPAGAAAGPSGG